ncbi:MAG: phosphoribosylformylglycinamidine cyclo-ligase [Alphaproteobacteria bacterium]
MIDGKHNNKKNQLPTDSYKKAGVDIMAGNDFAKTIGLMAQKTHQPFLQTSIGGFAAVIDMAKTGFRDPLMMLSCDGVGTKLALAQRHRYFDGIGFDLVAMAVNDILVMGAKPLAFLDYYACGKLEKPIAEKILTSISHACVEADCVLAGGETAEMPNFYDGGKFDLAGFVMGAIERADYDKRSAVLAGDRLIGLRSSGFHSNGFSLIRRILDEHHIDEAGKPPYESQAENLASDLLTPTRIYKKIFDAVGRDIKAAAHITGGGLLDNLPRVFADNLVAYIDKKTWVMPDCFAWLQNLAGLSNETMWQSFNCGIGMVLFVAADKVEMVLEKLKSCGEQPFLLGAMAMKKNKTDPAVVID